ncbi:hypothetical protein [Corynebacterium diphtheriae]|uniref:hypothetical protein n=1 Tax=Corynebacterium diphtheriae TaxID=1717 RepID=UPI001BFE4936|nr:hypothetical protein [Corynebacterium diphtheriae]
MFKRSLAPVAAVAIASGAVVAPANAVAVRVDSNMTCTFSLNAEEVKLTDLNRTARLSQQDAASFKKNRIEPQLSDLRAEIEKAHKELAKVGPDAAEKERLTRELKESEKKLTANKNFRDALTACIDGKYYNSDQLGDSKNPGGTDQSGDSQKPGGTEKPKAPSNPGATPAPPSNDGAGIGVIFAASIAAVLGILAAALPFIKPILPPQLRALLP